MSKMKGGGTQTTQWYIIQPTIAFVFACMAKIQYVSSTNSLGGAKTFIGGAKTPPEINPACE